MYREWWHDKVAYQIYPKSFCDSNGDGIGDLKGIISKLDYLKELGVDILWISPIYQSPMVDQGYDISDYYEINEIFGSMEDMEELLREAKKRNLYILMDLVLNHCSDQHQWFQKAMADLDGEYADYFYIKEGKDGQLPCNWRSYFGGSVWEKIQGTDKYYLHLFDKTQPDLNWENKKVREELYKMINWWAEKGVDGFRIDAIINVKKQLDFKDYEVDREDGLSKIDNMLQDAKGVHEFLMELKEETFQKHNSFTVGEVFNDKPGEMKKFIGKDGCFSSIFDFSIEESRMNTNWYENKKLSPEEIKAIILREQGKHEEVGLRANVIENHDQPRGASAYFQEETGCKESITMLATIQLLLRGIPFIYQGQEIGMQNMKFASVEEFNDIYTKDQYQVAINAGFSEEEALEVANRNSRDNSRTPFQWSQEKEAGFTTGTPWLKVNPNYMQINVEVESKDETSVLAHYKKTIQLRKDKRFLETFVYGKTKACYEDHKNLLAFYRMDENKKILVVANYQSQPQELFLEDEVKEVLLHNYSEVQIDKNNLQLRAYEAIVFQV